MTEEERRARKRIRQREWREKNREYDLARKKAWLEENRCKEAERHKAWYAENREKDLARKREWDKANADRIAKRRKASKEKFALPANDQRNERSASWRWKQANREKHLAYVRAWNAANRERRAELERVRRSGSDIGLMLQTAFAMKGGSDD